MSEIESIAPIIELKNVSVSFGHHMVHKQISFAIGESETVTLLGPSGTGKTVILKLIMGLIPFYRGEIRVLGKEINSLDEHELNELRMKVGMLFQGAALFDSLNVYENVAYGLREHGWQEESRIADVVHETLEIVGLPKVEHKNPAELSGGQKKRVALARALACGPRVMLFDEPTTGLDPTTRRLIDEMIIRLREDFKITSLIVTHDIESAKRISTRWILVDGGQIMADGPVADMIHSDGPVIDFISGNWRGELKT